LALPATVGCRCDPRGDGDEARFNGTDVVASIVIERMVGFVLALALGLASLAICARSACSMRDSPARCISVPRCWSA
jgi:hypothetical protein